MKIFHRRERFIPSMLILLALAVTAGCGSSFQGTKPSKALSDAPSETAALFQSRCISCHGSELQGRVGNATNLQQVGARLTESDIASRIREGGGDGMMPAFGEQLSEVEITALARWLAGKQ